MQSIALHLNASTGGLNHSCNTVTYLNNRPAYDWYKHLNGYEESSAALWKNMMSAVTKRFGFWWYDNYGQGMFDNQTGDTRCV